jgi:hypothetical protein
MFTRAAAGESIYHGFVARAQVAGAVDPGIGLMSLAGAGVEQLDRSLVDMQNP